MVTPSLPSRCRARARLGTAARCHGADRPFHRRRWQRSFPGYGVSGISGCLGERSNNCWFSGAWICALISCPYSPLIVAMQPSEALGIAAQVAVTLAGFAGIVVVFRPDSVHRWSPLDKLRLQLLLTNSALPLAESLFGMLLLTFDPPPASI